MSGARGPATPRGAVPRARLPLLDRLLEPEAGQTDGTLISASAAEDLLRDAVKRDLEALLNARRRRRPLPARHRELVVSPLNYGLPDPTSGAYAIPERREELAREVELTLRRFEPRLRVETVLLLEDADGDLARTLRVKVRGVLQADPVVQEISFETLVEPVTRDVVVREE